MNCYTRKGDLGTTSIFGEKLEKHDERISAIGDFDELNSFLGAAVSFSTNESVKKILEEVQNDLFTIGAELATVTDRAPSSNVKITAGHVEVLEVLIEKVDMQLPEQTKFIIPQGTRAAMLINIARAVARRAERALVKVDRKTKLNPELLKYANRLSSLLYVLSRFENIRNNVTEKNPVYKK